MMKSIKLMKSRHSNTTPATTSLARRAFLLMSVLLMSVGSAWGATITTGTPVSTSEDDLVITDNKFTINGVKFQELIGAYPKYIRFTAYNSSNEKVKITNVDSEYRTAYYHSFDTDGYVYGGTYENALWSTTGIITVTLPDGVTKLEIYTKDQYVDVSGDVTEPDGGALITYTIPVPFEGEKKSTCDDKGAEIKKYLTTETQLPLDVTKATAHLPSGKNARYARFYVLHNGVAENLKTNTTLLEISGVSPATQLPTKGIYGYYLYNSGADLNLSGIAVKLNAAAGTFPEYQVVCVLSTDAADAATGNVVTEEPDWDVVFTYSFRNQVTTNTINTETVAWDAIAMTASIPTTDIATDWQTSWANLAQEQKIEWYVTDGSDNVQPLETGTARQDNKWTINLSSPFTLTSNVAVLTDQISYTASSFESMWATWGNPVIYAPANKSFADVQDYKIICKIADDANPSANANVKYTLSLTNTFAGQEKSAITKTTTQVKLATTTDTSKDIDITLPTGTKYARFYVIDGNGDAVDATDAAHQLAVTGGLTYTDKTLGYYLYNGSGISLSSITFSGSSADLDDYQVVMVTSSETAVLDGGAVKYEPDYESQTTFWFNYPATAWNPEANIEWSAQSMQITAPDIETQKGSGYLDKKKSHYTLQWMVVDKDGNAQPMRQGTGRANDYWSVSVNGDPFALANENKVLTVKNDVSLSVVNWNKWTSPVFFAPKNKTMKEITDAGIKFICKFYEDDETPLLDTQLGMTYTVDIDRTERLGKLKDGGERGGKTIDGLTSSTTSLTIDLTAATTAFQAAIGTKATYARVFLTKSDGTMLDPTTGAETLTGVGGTAFTTPEYGYYFQDEASGVTLPSDATLALPAGKFNYYYVVVAMSKDTGENGHTAAFAPRRAGSVVTIYEPDYDYIYTIKFAETSTFPGTLGIDFSHSKEVLVKDESVKTATLTLADSKAKILSEYLVADWATLRNNFHVRWYVAKKNDEGDFEKIPNSELYLTAVNAGIGHNKEEDQGLYWNSVAKFSSNTSPSETEVLNITFNRNPGGGAPELTGNWEDYKIFAVMTKDLTGQTVKEDKDIYDNVVARYLTKEPDKLNMIYRFSFFKESTFQFVHDTGAGSSVFMKKADDVRMNATVQQYSWDNSTSTRTPESEDVRQWVHTMEYDVYVDPSSSTPVVLHLPFEKYYVEGGVATGNNLEPSAYIRWYDWTTDINSNRLAIVGSELRDMTETNSGVDVSRGFFFLNNSVNGFQPTHNKVGVTFNPNGIDGLITIACDVSKYYDGIYSGSTGEYLMHEPTLSTRYIFNIRPASVVATDIKTGQQKFEAKGSSMFELAEDNGRVCVSIKNTSSKFTVRSTLPTLDSYYFYNGSTLVRGNKITWLPYYVDEEGGIWKFNGYFDGVNTNRIKEFAVSALSGTYLSDADGVTTKTVTVGSGTRIHLIGFIYDDAATRNAPLVHYELNFLEAPAYDVSSLPLERTEAYLKEHMTLQDQIIFDDATGAVLSPTIDSQLSNHTNSPMEWSKAQYGFCYPDVRRIWTGSGDPSGISPIHGDYMLLRSMNLSGISTTDMEYYYKYHWYVGSPTLYDYTKTMGGDYGTFLYVDASDESRTIARMSFNATLCAGSELCFTGVIANMTSGTNPQVMTTVYAVNSAGKRTRVVSFHSTELSLATATTFANGIWYQIYGRIPIPATTDLSDVDHYEVDIDNYALDTNGADYCVDQLMFYTSNAKLKVKQSGVNCGDVEIPLNLYVTAESIEHMAGKTIFWRICDADGNALADASLYDNGGKLYGQTTVPSSIPEPLPTEASLTIPFSGYFEGIDGVTYFSLANKGFKLKEGVDYYISVYSMGETSVSYESLWGNPVNTCSVFSPIFVPKMMYLTMKDGLGDLVTTVVGGCSDKKAGVNLTVVLNMPDEDEVSGFKPYADVPFDFFLGSLDECNAYALTGKPSVLLIDALKDFRSFGSATPNTTSYADKAAFVAANSAYLSSHEDYYKVILQALDEELLFLDASATFNHTVQGNTENLAYISALPIKSKVNNGIKDFDVCSPLEFVFSVNASGNGPSLTLGFDDVTGYPDGIRVIRVGKEQLTNMQKDGGFLLHIPVNTFKKNDSAAAKDGTLQIQGDLELLAYNASANQTSDDQIAAKVEKVATFADTEITSSKMYVSLNFHGASVIKPTFQEGFAYRMFFQYKDKDGGIGACEGSTEFLLKVVPEFVTWNGTSAEWNDDANWKRSSRTELNKGLKGSATNTATAGHPDGYEQNGEGTLAAVATTPNTYVPMKFTYVTLPEEARAPYLVNLTYDSEKIYNNIGTGATENIQYDLMVRYKKSGDNMVADCEHGASAFDCEKFYGNWAKEIYFKPGAELMNQQYLTYEKVWVEKELKANSWTLMATPLQNTYAGDMYVPVSSTEADNGRQLSEAFQPIVFSTTTNAAGFTYSRAKYPIYQKGWTQKGVYTYTKANDVRKNSYSANIPGSVELTLDQWSHEYNDVTVPYSTWTAFAIRPHKKDQTAKTLIRLPKADTSYDYYQWDNKTATTGAVTEDVSKITTGKLLTDGTPNIVGVTYGTDYGTTPRTAGNGNFSPVRNDASNEAIQSAHGYQLVGNPYLCSIDMATFLTENSANLDNTAGYWTYDSNNTGSPVTTGVIAPMQSFFVKLKDDATQITFTPDMMVDGNHRTPTQSSNSSRQMTLTAENGRGQSAASISVGEKVQSVETLFDSNLADVPMVYTVSNGKAVSIHQVVELTKPIAFGVTCNSNEAVEVTFSDIEQLTDGEVTVVDAVSGQMQSINEGDSFTVQPNEYGRYFLVFANTTGIETTLPTQGGEDGEKIIFDLQGRRVIYPGKGVYIVNGKKVLMK